jgi:hypothetical protein
MVMTHDFVRSLEGVLRSLGKREAPVAGAAPAQRALDAEAAHRRKWFAQFAAERVMPLLKHTVEALEKNGGTATCRLNEQGEALAAELVIVPRHLPEGVQPPRLTISAAPGERAVAVDYTGTFPYVGATGGFGAEIDYDMIYPSQVEEKILDFVALATGA